MAPMQPFPANGSGRRLVKGPHVTWTRRPDAQICWGLSVKGWVAGCSNCCDDDDDDDNVQTERRPNARLLSRQ